jgi:hypothetical protein
MLDRGGEDAVYLALMSPARPGAIAAVARASPARSDGGSLSATTSEGRSWWVRRQPRLEPHQLVR